MLQKKERFALVFIGFQSQKQLKCFKSKRKQLTFLTN